MAKMRKFRAYRKLEVPYTRKSKFKKKSYVKVSPNIKVVRFDMGNVKGKFDTQLDLVAKDSIQIRQEAIESARTSSNKILEEKVGKDNYYYKLLIYPHHVLRENPLAAGAGADRMSTGMQASFGKAIGVAAQIYRGKVVITLKLDKQHLLTAKLAMKRAAYKLPGSYSIVAKSITPKN